MAMTAESSHSASLYVGDLVNDVTEALLFEIFNAVGPVASVRVCRDAATRRSLGYAYVNFHSMEDAERALDTMNFKDIRNRPCRIMWSHRDPSLRKSGVGNIFVKHLDKTIDNKTLYDTFSMFGNILSCKVAQNSRGESLGYGFVHYESGPDAQNAITRVNGKVISGQKVEVQAFKSKNERGGGNSSSFTNVYVKNLPEDFTKERLEEMFGAFGAITSCMLAVKDGKARGFGFVNYADHNEANAAVTTLNEKDMGDDKLLFVGRAQKKEEREKELRDRFEQLKMERQKKFAGVNLYVKNLGDQIDDATLRTCFEECGSITSCRVMMDSNGKSRGFGFVCFTTPEEATKAVNDLNGTMLQSKPLYVALAQRKDVRRAQLEAQHQARVKFGGGNQGPQMFGPGPGAPLYFQPGMMPGQQRMMAYPPQMLRPYPGQRPGAGPNGAMAGMPGGQRPVSSYQLMPAGARNGGQPGGPRNPQGAARQQRGGPRQQGKQMPGQGQQQQRGGPRGGPQQGAQQGQPNFKYTDNVVNNQSRQPQQQAMPAPTASQVPGGPQEDEPLTIKELARADPGQQKQMIGERLYPLIMEREPEKAGKITGMLLEMDNAELIHLLESREALEEQIVEANKVLTESVPQE